MSKRALCLAVAIAAILPAAPSHAAQTVYGAPWPEASVRTELDSDGTPYSDAAATMIADEETGLFATTARVRSGLPLPFETVEATAYATFTLPAFATATGSFEGVIRARVRGVSEAGAIAGTSSAGAWLSLSCAPSCGLRDDVSFTGPRVDATYVGAGTVPDRASQTVEWHTVERSFRSDGFAGCLEPGSYELAVEVIGQTLASMIADASVEAEIVLESITVEDVPCPAPA